MRHNQTVAEMARDVLSRQAAARAEQTGTLFAGVLEAVLETEAGRQFGELRNGPHGDERATRWQKSMSRERAHDRHREERDRAG